MIRFGLCTVAGLFVLSALPAWAQDVDRIAGVAAAGGGYKPPEGVKVVAPGALVFASFDRNFDNRVSMEEITAGAEGLFAVIDKNRDSFITGFEQTDWAAGTGGGADLLANAMTFDMDLDRSVSKEEFVSGLKRLALQIQPSGDLAFTDLIQPLSRVKEDADNQGIFGWGKVTPRGTPPGGRNN